MRMDIHFPFYVRGKPKRTLSDKDIYCSFAKTVDVPEVAPWEADIVFDSRQAYRFSGSVSAVWAGDTKTASPHTVRMYGGELFRRIGSPREISDGDLAKPFPTYRTRSEDLEQGVEISRHRVSFPVDNPICAALSRQIEWDLERASRANSRVIHAWPLIDRNLPTQGAKRHDITFGQIEGDLEWYDTGDYAASLGMIEAHASRLLSIGGELWMRCPPPAYCVMLVDNPYSRPWPEVGIEHVYDGFDRRLDRLYFPLSEIDDMSEYVQQLRMLGPRGDPFKEKDWTLPFAADDLSLFDFDHRTREIERTGLAVASEALRNDATKKMTVLLGATNETWRAMEAARPLVDKANHVTGVRPDFAPLLEGLFDAWTECGLPTAIHDLGPLKNRKKTAALMMKRAREIVEWAPIEVHSADEPKP